MTEIFKINLSKTLNGNPAVWENGGGRTNTGFGMIICGPRGERLRPIYVPRRGHLSNSAHALFLASPGLVIIEADHHRGDYYITVRRILKIDRIVRGDGEVFFMADAEEIGKFAMGAWVNYPGEEFQAAIDAAISKARHYHCREPHYIQLEENSNAC